MRRADFLKRLGAGLAGLVAAPTAVAAAVEGKKEYTRDVLGRVRMPMHTPLTKEVDKVMYPILGRHIDFARLWPIARTGDAKLWHLNVGVDGKLYNKRIVISGVTEEVPYQIVKQARALARELA